MLFRSTNFHGVIANVSGTGDVLDLHGFAAATTTATTGAGSFDSDADTTTLTVTDTSQTTPHSETFTLAGDLSSSTWTISDDHNGGANIVDPPGSSQNVGGVVMHDPGPAPSSTIVASAPNQVLTGTSASDTFAFNFSNVGHDTVANFHPDTDTLQFLGSMFATAQAALNATQDDGHGNTVVTLDTHDTITLSGVAKTQLHISDFHVV